MSVENDYAQLRGVMQCARSVVSLLKQCDFGVHRGRRVVSREAWWRGNHWSGFGIVMGDANSVQWS